MRENTVKNLWEQHKRFLMVAGAGLAVFLVLNSLVSSYVASADHLLEEASRLAGEAGQLKQDLKGQYWEIKGRLAAYEQYEERLRKDLSMPPEQALQKLDKRALLVQFNEATESVWRVALEFANQRGVELPERLSAEEDFGYEITDGPEEFKRYYDYLAITRQSLVALLKAGMREIRRPELIPEDLQPIRNNGGEAFMMLRAVRFGCVGAYGAYVRLLKSVQKPGDFLQVQILSLSPVKNSDDGLLKGELRIKAVVYVDAKASASQRAALLDFAKSKSGPALRNVVRVESAPIQLAIDHVKGRGQLKVGQVAKIETRFMSEEDSNHT